MPEIINYHFMISSFPARKRNNSPFPIPSPLPRPTITAATLSSPKLLILTGFQTNNDICFACS